MYKIVFSKTGDSLNIVSDNHEMLEYWLFETKKANKEKFLLEEHNLPTVLIQNQLTEAVSEINLVLTKFKIEPFILSSTWLDQSSLNYLHRQWVLLQQKHTNILNLLNKFSGATKKFHDINKLIHQIEESTNVAYINDIDNVWQVENIFGPGIQKFGLWQIQLSYQNLGRSTYSKWYNYDDNVEDQDTNDATHLGGRIEFNLTRPYTALPPNEYIKYCKDRNLEPYGLKIPIGNLDLDITNLRILFSKNVHIENNTISFEI